MDKVNDSIFVNLTQSLANGHMSAEDFSKLLNTMARYQERVHSLDSSDDKSER